LLTVSRYIELNPIRAKMVSHPAKYPWSSYQKNVSGKAIELITPHSCYLSLGNNEAERQQAYQSLFESQPIHYRRPLYQIIANFPLFHPTFKDHKIHGAIAGKIFPKHLQSLALKKGYYVLTQQGDHVEQRMPY
jgi:hypothetical protein